MLKYSAEMCIRDSSIAYNILNNHEDSKECVNDTYVGVWNAIPPTRPVSYTHLDVYKRQASLLNNVKRNSDYTTFSVWKNAI